MLGHTYRFRAVNSQNQAITVTLKARLWKYNATGVLTFSDEVTLINAQSVAATTGNYASANVDNTTDLFERAELTLIVQAALPTNGAGALVIYREHSSNGGATWPNAERGTRVGGLTLLAGDGTNVVTANLRFR